MYNLFFADLSLSLYMIFTEIIRISEERHVQILYPIDFRFRALGITVEEAEVLGNGSRRNAVVRVQAVLPLEEVRCPNLQVVSCPISFRMHSL